jgi:hypothetical protein
MYIKNIEYQIDMAKMIAKNITAPKIGNLFYTRFLRYFSND